MKMSNLEGRTPRALGAGNWWLIRKMNIKNITHLYRTQLINWINKFIVERALFNDTFRVVRGLGDSMLPWSPYTLLGSRGGCKAGSWRGRGYVTGCGTGCRNLLRLRCALYHYNKLGNSTWIAHHHRKGEGYYYRCVNRLSNFLFYFEENKLGKKKIRNFL